MGELSIIPEGGRALGSLVSRSAAIMHQAVDPTKLWILQLWVWGRGGVLWLLVSSKEGIQSMGE